MIFSFRINSEVFFTLDAIDKKILGILQSDTTPAVAEIAKKVGLSTTPCWRRIQKWKMPGLSGRASPCWMRKN